DQGEPFGVGEGGLDRGERGGWGSSGHRAPPGQAGTREAGPVPAPAVQRKPNVSCLARSRYAGNKRAAWRSDPREEHSIPPTRRAMQTTSAVAQPRTERPVRRIGDPRPGPDSLVRAARRRGYL